LVISDTEIEVWRTPYLEISDIVGFFFFVN